jgi:NAD-reducing hydrogenase small subunit
MKARIATAWLGGCSGCHMSLLDIDERLLDLADKIELVYSPIVDTKEFPENVDVTLVEGSVANVDNEATIRRIRERTRLLVSLGDCAVTGNVPSMRNYFEKENVLHTAYNDNVPVDVPALLPRVRPIHSIVKVDLFVPGCPPSADVIYFTISEVLQGRIPQLESLTRFGK